MLADFELRLTEPGIHLLAGGHGSGKTVLSRILTGGLRPHAGRVELDSEPLCRRFGGPSQPLQFIELGCTPEGDDLLSEYLEAEVWRSGGQSTALLAYWESIEALIPHARQRETASLSLGELCLAQVALAAASASRVTVLDGQFAYMQGALLRQAGWMLQEAAGGRERFIVVTALDPAVQLGGSAQRFELSGRPVGARRVVPDSDGG